MADGTAAIQIALMALGVGPGDEVITVPFTWISTAEVIPLCGAKPVFVDVDANTFNIDVSKVEAAITPQTKAIIGVSLFGLMCDAEALQAIADKHSIAFIEDAAQSFGAERNGKRSGSVAKISTTSFFPTKPLGCFGDGGAILTDDAALAERCTAIARHGALIRGQHFCVGMNSRLDAMQAAILLVKLKHWAACKERRMRVGQMYTMLLRDVPGVVTPYVPDGCASVYAQYTVKVSPEKRAAIRAALKEAGVPTASYYNELLHTQEVFKDLGYDADAFPAATECSNSTFSLPMHQWLDEKTIAFIVDQLREATK